MNLRGKPVVVYLQGPREQFWGLLRALDPAGALVEGIEAESMERWARSVVRDGAESSPASVVFFPSARIEKILLDQPSASVPSLEERFRQITGESLTSHLGQDKPLRTVPFPDPSRDPR